MSHRTRVLLAFAGSCSLALGVPAVTAAATAAPAVTSFDVNSGVLHHNGDPRQGSITIVLSLQEQVVDGRTSIRAHATVTKAGLALRVQIDQLEMSLQGFNPSATVTANKPVNSGANPSVTNDTPWYDRTGTTHGATFTRGALVRYSTRWSDGTLTSGIFRTGDDEYSSTFAKQGNSVGDPYSDAYANTVVTHYGDPARGSVRVSAEILIRDRQEQYDGFPAFAIQAAGQIQKMVGASRVQIDAVEAQGYSKRADGTQQLESVWPANTTSKNSGGLLFTYLHSPYTSVTEDRSGVLRTFRVVVYYSVRWDDGTMTTGKFVGPMSKYGWAFKDGIGTFAGF